MNAELDGLLRVINNLQSAVEENMRLMKRCAELEADCDAYRKSLLEVLAGIRNGDATSVEDIAKGE